MSHEYGQENSLHWHWQIRRGTARQQNKACTTDAVQALNFQMTPDSRTPLRSPCRNTGLEDKNHKSDNTYAEDYIARHPHPDQSLHNSAMYEFR